MDDPHANVNSLVFSAGINQKKKNTIHVKAFGEWSEAILRSEECHLFETLFSETEEPKQGFIF